MFLISPKKNIIAEQISNNGNDQNYTLRLPGTCVEPSKSKEIKPTPYCQAGYSPNNTFEYIVPCKDISDKNTCRIIDGTSVGEGFEWHNVDSINYKSGDYIIQTSNQKSLIYQIRGNEIYFIQDTTFSNSATCSNGKPAFQRINGKNGILWAPKSMSCDPNYIYASEGINEAYEYSENEEEYLRTLPDNVIRCQNQYTGNVSGTKQLVFNGNAKCGSFSGDILVIRNESGAGSGEIFIYCKGIGLCGWYQDMDFSDPSNNPKNWVGKDICSKSYSMSYGACHVECPEGGINKPVYLSLSEYLKNLLGKVFQINLLNLEPAENTHKIAIEKQSHLNMITQLMLPNEYKLREKGQRKPRLKENEKLITLNQATADITIRSNIKTPGDEITANIDNKSAELKGESQIATSEDTLWNDRDCKECREIDDYQKILGSISSINRLEMNKQNEINLTKKPNLLADRIIVPDNPSQTSPTKEKESIPINKNKFLTKNISESIIIGIASGIADTLGKIAEALNIQIQIPTVVTSCTKISNDDDLYKNTKIGAYAFIPKDVIKRYKLEEIPMAGETNNKYRNPIAGLGEDIKISQAFYPTNFVNTTINIQNCSTIPRNTKLYLELCNTEYYGTSNWSLELSETPINIENPFMDQIITEETNKVGIPTCVLKGVGIIEGAYGWNLNDEQRIRECRRNECSAAGPFQFTTGAPCGNCPAGYCPNAWAIYGNGGNPCEPRTAANAAARKLKNDGPLTNGDPKNQLEQILNAGYRYYGSRRPVNRLKDSFGNSCSYGQYVYLQCDPSFNCANSPR